MKTYYYQNYINNTPLKLKIVEEDSYIIEVSPTEVIPNETKESNFFTDELDKYFEGRLTKFKTLFKLDNNLSLFSKKVYEKLSNVSYGETITYQELGLKAGYPNSARAVGKAMASNKLLIILPCHRVVGRNKKLTGFRMGIKLKKDLLDLECKG